MAQHQRQEDEQWISPLRKVARLSAKRREYTQLLREHQQLPRPQTGPLPVISSENYSSWYEYVEALEQQRQLRLKQEAREHANHMNVERERTQKHITSILSSINPSSSFQARDTSEISLSGIASQETIQMPAIQPPPSRARETKAPRLLEEVAPFLDHAIRLFVWQYNVPPTHIRLSSYNYRQLALEYNHQTIDAYTNPRGTFFLIPDYTLDDTTVVCEEHVLQQ